MTGELGCPWGGCVSTALFARPSSHPQPGGQSNANVRQLTSVLTEVCQHQCSAKSCISARGLGAKRACGVDNSAFAFSTRPHHKTHTYGIRMPLAGLFLGMLTQLTCCSPAYEGVRRILNLMMDLQTAAWCWHAQIEATKDALLEFEVALGRLEA